MILTYTMFSDSGGVVEYGMMWCLNVRGQALKKANHKWNIIYQEKESLHLLLVYEEWKRQKRR